MCKKLFTIFVVPLLLCSFHMSAQEIKNHFDKEAFAARRNAFITAEVGLTPEEAADFIPLYNELHEKLFEAGSECRRLYRELRRSEKASDADYMKAVDVCVEVKIRQAQLEKEYYEQFKKILSPKKILWLQRAESKFAREYMKGRRGQRRDLEKK